MGFMGDSWIQFDQNIFFFSKQIAKQQQVFGIFENILFSDWNFEIHE
jgi:hypothetical protein